MPRSRSAAPAGATGSVVIAKELGQRLRKDISISIRLPRYPTHRRRLIEIGLQ